jgi:hypothetical protein
MNAATCPEASAEPEALDVLTQDEERVLASLRDAADGARATGAGAGFDAILQAILSSGASKEPGECGADSQTLVLRGVRFVLSRSPGSALEAQVSFPSGNP